MTKKNNNKSAIRTDKDKKVARKNRAIYSATDPTTAYPSGIGLVSIPLRAGASLFNPDDMWYEVTDSVADAAWRKRLGLSYDDKFLIKNKNGSYRLPKNVEMEIPTDTTFIKNRIAANEKLANQSNIVGEDWKLVDAMIDLDKKTLDALRKTYKTGDPVVINEYSNNSRKLAKDGELVEGAHDYKTPLNVLQNYTIQYDPLTNTMKYRDTYDFNGFESFVPGEPFDIEGEIPLRKYSLGSWLSNIGTKLDGWNSNLTDKFLDSGLGKGLSSFGIKSGGIGGIANTAATAIGGLLAGKNKTGVGNALQGIGSLASNIPGVGGLIGAGVNLIGGITNAAFGSNINKEFVNSTEAQARQQSNYVSGATDNDSLLSDWGSLTFLGDVSKSDVGSDGWFSNKAGRETDRLNNLVDEANMRALASISNTAENIDKQNDLMLMANYSAYGGPLDMKYTGTMSPFGNQFGDGGLKKRKYIGGSKDEVRRKYFNYDTELSQVLSNLAASYGISPALVFDRLGHEGLVDRLIRDNNEWVLSGGDPNYPADAFDMDDYNEPFGLLGLDNIFDTYTKGFTKTKRPINFIRQVNLNEKNEKVNSGETKNLYDTLELFVAELASRRNQVKKQYPNLTDDELDSATAARYNASNKYFKQLMDSGEYKTKYPINVKGINIPAPTKTDSKYIQEQEQNVNVGDILNELTNHYYGYSYTADGNTFTFGNKSWNPKLFVNEHDEIGLEHPMVDTFINNYINDNYTIPSKVKVNNDYYEDDNTMEINKKANGGNLFTNGVTTIGNGGTHESNPYEGVQMGIDPQGIPNLVEEGEVIYDDYVFSNRLRVPKEVRQKYKLRGITFADAAKQLQKESEERPNDPISKNGLDAAMVMLQQEQETVRMKKESNKYAKGGKLSNKFLYGGNPTIDNPYSPYSSSNGDYSEWFTLDLNNSSKVTSYSDLYKNLMFTADMARAYAKNNPNDESLKSFLSKGNKLENLTDEDVRKGSLDTNFGWLHKARANAAKSLNYIDESKLPTRGEIISNLDRLTGTPILNRNNTKVKDIPIVIEDEEVDEEPLPSYKGIEPMKTNWLRYTPIVGSGLAVANDLFGGNKPDYSNSNIFQRAIEGTYRPIRGRQIGNYLRYTPFDRDFYISKLNADASATRRGIMNTSGGNRAAAMAGLLAADYNYGNQLGALARQAEEYNLAQRQAVEEFNRGTNITNAEMATKADMANAEQAMQRARMYGSLAEYRDKILAANRAEKSANLTNFIQGLGDLGKELTDRDMLRWLADLGVFTYNPNGLYTGTKKSKGGRINRKKRGGFTI